MVRLFSTAYPEKNPERRAEYAECLRRNLANPHLGEVCLLVEGPGDDLPAHPKLRVRPVTRRPRYDDFFAWIDDVAGPEDLSIIANTDIWFDEGLGQLAGWPWGARTVFALSRWDVQPDGSSRLFERGDSQDAWIVQGPVEHVRGDFPLGVYDCDNKIAWEFAEAGYQVLNPAFAVRCRHLHLGALRSYDPAAPADHGIRPPFLYVEADNLWSLPAALRRRRRLRLDYVPWKMTWLRFFRYPLPKLAQRVWRRVWKMLRS